MSASSRPLGEYYPHHVGAEMGDEVLRVEALSSPGGFRDISFALRAGEVVGLAGRVGAGRSEIAQRCLAWIPCHWSGLGPRAATAVGVPGRGNARGLGLVPEDLERAARSAQPVARILVLRSGSIAGELARSEATQEAVMHLMAEGVEVAS